MAHGSPLAATGLSEEQLLHFAEHGWVVLEEALSPEQCRRYVDALDRILERFDVPASTYETDRGTTWGFNEPHLHDPIFLELYQLPGLVPALRQLIGHPRPMYGNASASYVIPEPDRHTRREDFRDRTRWGWHRCFRPKNIITEDDDDRRFINSALVNMGVYFVPISPDDGVTAFLDKSHRVDGDWGECHGELYRDLGDQLTTIQPSGGAGTIVLFSEGVIHTSTPVLSDQPRYASFNWFIAPWLMRDGGKSPHRHEILADEELRSLFRPQRAYA